MKILILLSSLLFVSVAHGQKKEVRRAEKTAEAIKKYEYPVSSKTGLIAYERTVAVPGVTRDMIYRRLNRFLAIQDYGRSESIRCRNNTNISTVMFEKDVLYKDDQDAKIAGNGFVHLKYSIRSSYDYILVFKYTLQAKENEYKYSFTDFKVLEFLSAPKSNSKGGGMGTAIGGAVFTSARGTTTYSSTSLTQEALEDFITRNVWQTQDGGHNAFIAAVKRIFADLKTEVSGE